jgi:hypothetical protein
MKLSRSTLDELLNATLKTADMLAAQGALFSIAAIITSIFAPLAFLAQVRPGWLIPQWCLIH